MANKIAVLSCLLSGAVLFSSSVFAGEDDCGLLQCHGLELSCGPGAPQACTAVYQLGDFCRQFASCRTVDGACRLVETREFRGFKSCVEDCARIKDPVSAFDCEARCRKEYERSATVEQE